MVRAEDLLVEVRLFFLFHAVATKEIGQVLREGSTRHHCVATRFDGFGLEVSLQMRKETDDRGVSLQFGLELGDQSQRLGIRIVEVEDDEAGQIFVFTGGITIADMGNVTVTSGNFINSNR